MAQRWRLFYFHRGVDVFLNDAGTQSAFSYGDAFNDIVPGITSEVPLTGTITQWVAALSDVAKTYALTNAQRQLLDVQVERARAGLPPLDSTQYGLGVNVGVGSGTQTTLMIIAAILAGAFILKRVR